MKVNTTKLRKYLNWFKRNIPANQFLFSDFMKTKDGAIRFWGNAHKIQQRLKSNKCGTVGCVIGHVDHYTKTIDKDYPLITSSGYYERRALEEFEMDRAAYMVFFPVMQSKMHFDLPNISSWASKTEALNMFYLFCDMVDDGRIKLDG